MRTDAYRGGPIARLQGLSIGIVNDKRVTAAATIAFFATDMLWKVYINRYFGHQPFLKITPDRLPFEQYIFIGTNQYLLVKATIV